MSNWIKQLAGNWKARTDSETELSNEPQQTATRTGNGVRYTPRNAAYGNLNTNTQGCKSC
jgi:hypothetical protein